MSKPDIIIHQWIKNGDVEAVLDLSNLELNMMIPIPINVKKLNISNNNITELSALPTNLKELDCSNNKIKKMMLPLSLEKIICSNNDLKVYPNQGESIKDYNMGLMLA